MRTWKMTKNPKDKKDAVLCQYFLTNTTEPSVCIILPTSTSVTP